MFEFGKLLFKYWPDVQLVVLCGIGLHGLQFLLGFEALNAGESQLIEGTFGGDHMSVQP